MRADASLPSADPWRRAFRLTPAAQSFRVQSAGVDGVFGTGDDQDAESRPGWRP